MRPTCLLTLIVTIIWVALALSSCGTAQPRGVGVINITIQADPLPTVPDTPMTILMCQLYEPETHCLLRTEIEHSLCWPKPDTCVSTEMMVKNIIPGKEYILGAELADSTYWKTWGTQGSRKVLFYYDAKTGKPVHEFTQASPVVVKAKETYQVNVKLTVDWLK